MSAFRNLQPIDNSPAKVVTIPRSAFASDYAERPVDDAKMGLRLLSEADIEDARTQALVHARQVATEYADRVDAFNDALVRLAVARSTTNPNDETELYFGKMADVKAGSALTVDGARRIYEEIVLFTVEQSPLSVEASDDAIAGIVDKLASLPGATAARLRRVLGYVVASLDEVALRAVRRNSYRRRPRR